MPSEEPFEAAVTHRELFVEMIKYNWTEEGAIGKILVLALVLSTIYSILVLAGEVINVV